MTIKINGFFSFECMYFSFRFSIYCLTLFVQLINLPNSWNYTTVFTFNPVIKKKFFKIIHGFQKFYNIWNHYTKAKVFFFFFSFGIIWFVCSDIIDGNHDMGPTGRNRSDGKGVDNSYLTNSESTRGSLLTGSWWRIVGLAGEWWISDLRHW